MYLVVLGEFRGNESSWIYTIYTDNASLRCRPDPNDETFSFCGGFFLLNDTPGAHDFLDEWIHQLRFSTMAKNQPALNRAIFASLQKKLRLLVLPCDLYPNGWRYFCLEIRARKKRFNCGFDWRMQQKREALMVHVTYAKGAAVKRDRLKQIDLWHP